MKSDVQRQTEYQNRRKQSETRVTIWVPNDVAVAIDGCRGDESRTAFINSAIAARLKNGPAQAHAALADKAATVGAAPAARPDGSVVYRGLHLWPPAGKATADGPPEKPDVDAAFWLTASLHRTLLAYGASQATAARRTRNWARHIARIVNPATVARLMREMSDRLDATANQPDPDHMTASRVPRPPAR